MMASLQEQLATLHQPAPDLAEDDEFADDVTKARVLPSESTLVDDGQDETSHKRTSKLRRTAAPTLADLDIRYRGRTTTRKDLYPSNQPQPSQSYKDVTEDMHVHFGSDQSSDGKDDLSGSSDIDHDDGSAIEDEEHEQRSEPPLVSAPNEQHRKLELAKAMAVRDQVRCWERLLALRMRLQPLLKLAVKMPRDTKTLNKLAQDSNNVRLLAAAQKQLCKLSSQLLDTAARFDESKNAAGKKEGDHQNDDDEEITSSESEPEREPENQGEINEPDSDQEEDKEVTDDDTEAAAPTLPKKRRKRKFVSVTQLDTVLGKRQRTGAHYRNDILRKWHSTLSTSRNANNKNDIVAQIDEILSDRDRLLARTRVYRSDVNRIGQVTAPNETEKDSLDVEHFDDDDFYQQLLKDLIERKTSVTDGNDTSALTRQWLNLQKLRGRSKRKLVDQRASKGRKVRYEIYKKMLNYMAPVDRSTYTDEASAELFKSLFASDL